MSMRPFVSYTSLMLNVSRNTVGARNTKCIFIIQKPHLTVCAAGSHLFPPSRMQYSSIDKRLALPLPNLTLRTFSAESHFLQKRVSCFIWGQHTLKYSNEKCNSDPTLISRALLSKNSPTTSKPQETTEKLSLIQRFKAMCKDYWHVVIPIHIITSIGWFGIFYYVATSGMDIPALLENFNLSEKFIKPFRDSSMGYIAVSYGLYKIFTPARYMVTLGAASLAKSALKKRGLIHPWPLNFSKLRKKKE